MATRIRLQRHGKKSKAFFHIVAADSRAKRDGKFIEKIGTYNPNTNPATIDINFNAALKWVQVGAEMTDTARAIMSYKGVLYKNHLLNGVKKGALTADQVEEKFNQWLADKDAKITGKQEEAAPEVEESTEVVAEEAPAEEPATEETPEEVPAPAEEPATETPEEVPATEEAAPEAPAADEASESTEETTEA
ncbi:MAG: 30S ribosomal protein S16 [Cryomorphaceae bacterium]|nr:30S ribosomal protein S16 [Cryomorphaceae bacterium]